jgi:hypothetical protein
LLAAAFACAGTVGAQSDDAGEAIDADSGSLDDATGSIGAGAVVRGWNFRGDLRTDLSSTETDNRDGSNESSSVVKGRFRIGGGYRFSDSFTFGARLASTCSTDQCDPEFVLDGSLPTRTSIEEGQVTFDELYVHAFRSEKFDVAIGRLQTKFVSRAGVFAPSLDRNDSHGTNVNWTDGVHGIWHASNNWTGHLILQKNDSDGTGNVRRGPLDFADDDSKVSYFMGWENFRRFGPINQQGFDITYLPRSLMKDGDRNGRIKDYIGLAARFAASWPEGSTGRRLNVAGEVGYAPETPTRAAVGLPGTGDTDGLAWLVSISAVDIRPNHSIGFNYGRADAGWLLSPNYRENDRAFEVRYVWRRSNNLAVDIRARWREELEPLDTSARKRKDANVFIRFTLGFGY